MSQYVVVDFEMCKVAKNRRTKEYHRSQEIIQIGAALLNEQYEQVETFDRFVLPKYGCLDRTISKLTGITDDNLCNADSLETVLQEFIDWIPEDAVLVSWSESDKTQLANETREKNITNDRLPVILEQWIDSQKMFDDRLELRDALSLNNALIYANITEEGRAHNGLADAVNTAKLFRKMMTEPELILNSYYIEARKEEVEHLSYSLGELFANLTFA